MNDLLKIKLIMMTKGLAFFVPVMGLYFTDNGVTLQALVYSQVIYVVFMMISEIPTGILGDIVGHKYSVALSGVVSAVSHIIMIFFPTTAGLYFAFAFRGVGGALNSGSDTALMHKYCQDNNCDFKQNLAQKQSYYVLGFLLSALVVGGLMQFYGSSVYILSFVMTMVALIAGSLLSLTIKTKLVEKEEDKITQGSNMLTYFRSGFKHILSVNCLRWQVVLFGLFMPGFHTFKQIYQPHFESVGVSPFMIGAVLSIGLGINFLFLRFGFEYLSKLPRIASLSLVYAGVIIGLFILGVSTSPVFAVLGFVIFLSMTDLDWPIYEEIYNDNIPDNIRSTVLSTISFVQSFITTGIRLGTGAAIGVLGFQLFTTWFSGYLLLAAIIVIAYLLSSKKTIKN